METYRILSCLMLPRNSLRSPLNSLSSPHMVGFGIFCLPYAPQRRSPLVDHSAFRPGWRETGETCTRAPSESGNSRLTCRREVKSEALSETLFTMTTTDLISVSRDQANIRCAVALCVAWTNKCGILDNPQKAQQWLFRPKQMLFEIQNGRGTDNFQQPRTRTDKFDKSLAIHELGT